jgi:hypothetical protein
VSLAVKDTEIDGKHRQNEHDETDPQGWRANTFETHAILSGMRQTSTFERCKLGFLRPNSILRQ